MVSRGRANGGPGMWELTYPVFRRRFFEVLRADSAANLFKVMSTAYLPCHWYAESFAALFAEIAVASGYAFPVKWIFTPEVSFGLDHNVVGSSTDASNPKR